MILLVKGSQYMRVDTIVSGKVFIYDRIVEASFAIKDGKIVTLGKNLSNITCEKRLEFNGPYVILPGMVDIHVHMRDLEQSYKEDWLSGSTAAVAGGITLVVDMPNTKPPTNNLQVLKEKIEIARSKSVVDFGFYFGVPNSIEELEEAFKYGIFGLKIYPDDYEKPLVSYMKECTENGKITVVHPESPEFLCDSEISDRHSKIRPPEAEVRAVESFVDIALRHSLRIHFTHISLASSLFNILKAKIRGGRVSCDVTPHHLFLNLSKEEELGYLSKVNPPLRSEENRMLLYNAFKRFLIDAYITDHAPHLMEEKMSSVYEEVPPGFPGLEIALPLLINEIVQDNFPLQIINLYSFYPAKLLNISKGIMGIGFDADFSIVNYKKEWVIKGEHFKSKAKYTPFEGKKIRGQITQTYIRGKKVYEEDSVTVKPGYGQLITPNQIAELK